MTSGEINKECVLEVCVSNDISVTNAINHGADRLELCVDLECGGLTPDYSLFEKTREETEMPIFVLIRPREGNFCYDGAEFLSMLNAIAWFKQHGADGIVSGILSKGNEIDKSRCHELIQATIPLPFTFHRAFDSASNAYSSMEILHELGVERVLTSGQADTAMKGLPLLTDLKKTFDDGPIILPGGGIRLGHVSTFKNRGFKEFHSSAIDYNADRVDMVSDPFIISQLAAETHE